MTEPDLRDPHVDRAYRETPRDEPPPGLDERIRAAARRAVGARPQSLEARRSWASRWRVPLSLAASVILVVTLTVMMQEEEQRALYREPPTAPSPSAPAAIEDRAVPRVEDESKRRDAAGAAAQPPAPARGAPVVPEPMRAPAADAATSPPSGLQKLEQRQQRLEEAPTAGVAPPPASAPATAPPAAQPRSSAPSLSRERAAGERPARAARSPSDAARSPEEWIEEIRRLKAQGREAEATAGLAELRRAYPDFQLPADLAR